MWKNLNERAGSNVFQDNNVLMVLRVMQFEMEPIRDMYYLPGI
jgi:hypothetical protein